MEVIWAGLRFHDVCDASGGFACCNIEGQGAVFCIIFVAGCLIIYSIFLYGDIEGVEDSTEKESVS